MITTIQAAIFLSYIVFLLIRFKKPLPSISDSWYALVGKEKVLFTIFCVSIGFLMFFQMDGTNPFFFFSGAGLIFTGTAAAFKEKQVKTVHLIGATTCIVSGLVALIYERNIITPSLIFVFIGLFMYVLTIKNRVWWIEILAFACICGGLYATQ